MIKVFINPHYKNPDNADGGIRRVTSAMWKYLPEFGIQPTDNIDEADVINNHGASLVERPGIPMVASCHGLYWHDYDWASWAHETNKQVIEVMCRANAITAPSKWVAHAIARGMLRNPKVIYHGIDIDEFEPDKEPADWVLWNKARIDPVSTPEFLLEITRRMPYIKFLTTIDKQREVVQRLSLLPNVLVVDPMPYEDMKRYVAKAGLYLATTRETFGIGTLEAMACGVPIIGWAYGGQEEIIKQNNTGLLVPFGDYDQLEKAIRLGIKERARLGANARQDIIERWQWKDKIEQYANIIKSVYQDNQTYILKEKPKVSIIVTCYNLAHYLDECLSSIKQSTMDNWECLIVDDCSTDNTKELTHKWTTRDSRFKYLKTPKNLGLSSALNYGFNHTTGKYILNLDADNVLLPTALEILSNELDKDTSIHIAYGHLDTMSDDGTNRHRAENFPPKQFLWRKQMAHLNQIPSTAMMRCAVLQESGGYRKRDTRNEDASFWCRVTSLGFKAKKVTEMSTFIYRFRSDSKSAMEHADGGERDWCAWYSWALASNAEDGSKLRLSDNSPVPRPDLVPWSTQGKPPKDWNRKRLFWPVRHLQQPAISVIIPCGPGHKEFLIDALDSLVAQDFAEWEVIVINDTGDNWQTIPGFPYAKIVTGKGDSKGAGAARNIGASIARGETLLFLDADDYLLPGAMSAMWETYVNNNRYCVVYGDWLAGNGENLTYLKSYDFTCDISKTDVTQNSVICLTRINHPVTCLVPKWAHYQANGFDESMPVWEDWDYQIRLYGIIGLCGIRLEQALMVYRIHTGQRRKVASVKEAEAGQDHVTAMAEWAKKYLYNAHSDLYKGKRLMACGSCSGKINKNSEIAKMSQNKFAQMMKEKGDGMILQYLGPGTSKISITGPATNKKYRVMNSPKGRLLFDVHSDDANELLKRTRRGNPLYVELKETTPKIQVNVEKPPQTAKIGMQDAPIQQPVQQFTTKKQFDIPAIKIANITQVSLKAAKEMINNADKPTLVSWLQMEKGKEPKPRASIIKAINRKLNDNS